MKRSLSVIFIVSATLVISWAHAQGQRPPDSPFGPQAGDAVLKMPGSDWTTSPTPPRPGNPANSALAAPFLYPSGIPQSELSRQGDNQTRTQGDGYGGSVPLSPGLPVSLSPSPGSIALAKLAPREGPDPNQDILVTPRTGPWMISIMCYTGSNAPFMARTMVGELRQNYRLPAYVCNYGADERRQEYERVRALVEAHKEYIRRNNLPPDQPLRIRFMRIEEQCGVLVGGYADEKVARRALDEIRKLPMPDPNRVALDTSSYEVRDQTNLEKVERAESIYVNPFKQAFVVRNPCVKVERPSEWDKLDVAVLRKLNANMPYDLFKCPKPFTLAVKEFQLGTIVQTNPATGMENFGFGVRSNERVDGAEVSAHSLAALLTKARLKAYVLHTKFSSIVTVGEFESINDPELSSMQTLLKTRLRLDDLQMLPTPLPMQVPGMTR